MSNHSVGAPLLPTPKQSSKLSFQKQISSKSSSKSSNNSKVSLRSSSSKSKRSCSPKKDSLVQNDSINESKTSIRSRKSTSSHSSKQTQSPKGISGSPANNLVTTSPLKTSTSQIPKLSLRDEPQITQSSDNKSVSTRSSRRSLSSSSHSTNKSSLKNENLSKTKISNEFIQTNRSSSRSSSRSSVRKSITLPSPVKLSSKPSVTKNRSSSRSSSRSSISHKLESPSSTIQAKAQKVSSINTHRSRYSRHSSSSSSPSLSADKKSNQISIPSLRKSTSTLHSSITESEILLSQSYFEDADRVVQDILLRSELSEKKKKSNNLNDAKAAAAEANSSSFNKTQKVNLNSNKISSRRSQNNTKTDSNSNSDSFSRLAKMEKRVKYKPHVNTDLHEESTHIELRRIKDSIKNETSKIVCPKRKEHIPFVFNDLTPYADTRHVEFLINSPLNNQPVGYYNRYTAMTIVEPWVAHRMEHTVGPLFAKSIRHTSVPRPQVKFRHSKDRPAKDQIEGSTLAPNFPKVMIKKPKGMNGPFYYDDIEIIRKELEKNLKNKARFEEDRNRTINDYYRMNLDQTADTEKTWDTFRAYLENTPGSKKALKEIIDKVKLNDSIAY